MLDAESYQTKVELHCQNSPSTSRLRISESISINSVRKIAVLHIDLIDKQSQSRILTMTEVMPAIIILGFHIMRYSGECRNRADLELLPLCHNMLSLSIQRRDNILICGK